MKTKQEKRDYVAVVFVGSGSTYYRCDDKVKAATLAMEFAKRDWRDFYEFGKRQTRQINVWDVTGHDKVVWDFGGMFDAETKALIDTHEIVEVFA